MEQQRLGSVTVGELQNFTVQKIDQRSARSFVTQYHYTGGMGNAGICWGLFSQDSLIGVIVFHAPISENVRKSVYGSERKDEVIELHRMAIHPNAPQNTATYFISRALDALKEYKPNYTAVLSFADTTEGHDGTVYQAASADYTGMTDETTFYKDAEGALRAPRQNGSNIDSDEAKRRGWEPVKRKSKHRYVFWLPGPYQSKDQLRQESDLEIQPYPDS
jgi:hypothetical protein